MFKNANKIVKTLIYSDFILNGAWGLLAPIFAIFILQDIVGGDVVEGAKVAGFTSLIYWSVKSVLQIPIGAYLDKNHGEKDDFLFMVAGIFLASLSPFGFLISSTPCHIYISQSLQAIGMAMMIPSSSAIFARHVDEGKEAYEYSLRSTSLGFGVGLAGAVGGIVTTVWGFKLIFLFVGIFTMVSGLILLSLKNQLSTKNIVSTKF
jgi:predicted MFS family arabinose efflux permease